MERIRIGIIGCSQFRMEGLSDAHERVATRLCILNRRLNGTPFRARWQ